MVGVFIGVGALLAAGILMFVFRRPIGSGVRATQARLFGNFGRRAGRTVEPMTIVVAIGFVLVALVAIVFVALSVLFPDTFHLSG